VSGYSDNLQPMGVLCPVCYAWAWYLGPADLRSAITDPTLQTNTLDPASLNLGLESW